MGTTYYFRTYASNWKGNVWASTTRSFTTVTSTVRENPVRNNDLKGWWKLDGNLLDSSGNNYHGDANFLWKPSMISELAIWLDAEDTSSFVLNGSEVVSWKSKSGQPYDFDQKTGDPSRILVNGKNVVNFDGNDQLWTDRACLATNFTIISVSRMTGGVGQTLNCKQRQKLVLGLSWWQG